MPPRPPRPAPTRFAWLLGSRDFTLLSATRVLITFAVQVQSVTALWLLYELTLDPLALGLMGLAEAGPALGLALHAGAIVDRGRPLVLYRRALVGTATSALLLCLVGNHAVPMTRATQVALIYLSAVVTGTARSFIGPSMFSLLPLIVRRDQMGRATATNTSLFTGAALLGPAAGGLLLEWLGAGRTFLIVLTLILAGLACAARLTRGGAAHRPTLSTEPPAERLLSGARFVWRHQVLLSAMSLDMFAVLFGGAVALFPVFSRDLFRNGPHGLGLLRSAMPAGSLLMSWYLVHFPVTRYSGTHLLQAVGGFGLCMIGFGVSGSFPLSLALLVMAGMFDSVSMVMRQTILQLATPPALRGRVSAVSSMFIGSSNEIGAFESGVAAKLLGTRPSVVFGALMTLVVVGVTWRRAPRLKAVELSRL